MKREGLRGLRQQRLKKLEGLKKRGIDPYPARTNRTHATAQVLALLEEWRESGPPKGEEGPDESVALCGRIMSVRAMGKASFAHIADGTGRIQIYVTQDTLGEEGYHLFRKDLDIGDFIAVEGNPFFTQTGEPTVRVSWLTLLAKSLRPLPEKWHGLKDVETRYRQRYLDLIANEEVRQIFLARSRIISAMRRFLDEQGFIEVETPILQPIYGGAAARPFETYHHALHRKLYLRIADELYLKRLIIGGFERVYEIGKDFRNEGLSTVHNPEFTQLEAYQAYADYEDMMRLAEETFAYAAQEVLGTTGITYQGNEIDLTPPWRRVTIHQAILQGTGIDIKEVGSFSALKEAIAEKGLEVTPKETWGKLVEELFKEYVEPTLIQPTFILDYPKEISPLAKEKPGDPRLVERFEFFIGGLECGNAFTELNDPLEQRERFAAEKRALESGEEAAHPMDEDFIQALEYGMPPTGGIGWGVDRMVMLFCDQSSIREVILFPQLRNKKP
jgi:lysyl-tRNA synthetase class 2